MTATYAITTLLSQSPGILAQSIGGSGGNGGFAIAGSGATGGGDAKVSVGGAGATGGGGGSGQRAGGVTVSAAGISPMAISRRHSRPVHRRRRRQWRVEPCLQPFGRSDSTDGAAASVTIGGSGASGGDATFVQVTQTGSILTAHPAPSATSRRHPRAIHRRLGRQWRLGGCECRLDHRLGRPLPSAGWRRRRERRRRDVYVNNNLTTGSVTTYGQHSSALIAQSIGGGGGNGGWTQLRRRATNYAAVSPSEDMAAVAVIAMEP